MRHHVHGTDQRHAGVHRELQLSVQPAHDPLQQCMRRQYEGHSQLRRLRENLPRGSQRHSYMRRQQLQRAVQRWSEPMLGRLRQYLHGQQELRRLRQVLLGPAVLQRRVPAVLMLSVR
jgi:hypothetical protein